MHFMTPGLGRREFFVDNLLVRTHFIIVMILWTGIAPWEFEFHFPGSLIYTLLEAREALHAPWFGVHPSESLRGHRADKGLL